MIRYSLQHMMFLEMEQIAELDRDVVAPIHQAGLDEAWQLIQTVPGIQDRSAASILAETGADMKQISDSQGFEFPGAGLSVRATTGARARTRAVTRPAGIPGCEAHSPNAPGPAAATKNCFLKDKFWRLTSRSGGEKAPALIAVAHVMLLLIYQVLEKRQPFDNRQTPPLDDRQRQRMIRHHVRSLGKLGISIHRIASVPAQPDAPN